MMEAVQVTGSMVEISDMHQQNHDVSSMVGHVGLPSLGRLPGVQSPDRVSSCAPLMAVYYR